MTEQKSARDVIKAAQDEWLNADPMLAGDLTLYVLCALERSGHLPDIRNLRAEIEGLRAENKRLREALENIAREPECGCSPCHSDCKSVSAKAMNYEAVLDIARAALDAKP